MSVLSDLMGPAGQGDRFYGVAFAIVTNNQDPEGLARVKVALPWLGDQAESDWARVVTPMAGPERGVYFLPEVDDEVLVAFEQGSPAAPYVLGGLWNGKDKPPESNSDGKNDRRTIKSRSGHVIRLTDTKDQEQIEITDSSGKNSIVISTKDNSVTVSANGDITIKAGGKLTLQAQDDLTIKGKAVTTEAQADLTIKGQAVTTEAKADLTIKGQAVNIN
jgi:phage baseplate assembly protein V